MTPDAIADAALSAGAVAVSLWREGVTYAHDGAGRVVVGWKLPGWGYSERGDRVRARLGWDKRTK